MDPSCRPQARTLSTENVVVATFLSHTCHAFAMASMVALSQVRRATWGAAREALDGRVYYSNAADLTVNTESLVQNASSKCGLVAGSDREFRGSTEDFDTDETGNVSRGSAMNGARVSVKKHDEAR